MTMATQWNKRMFYCVTYKVTFQNTHLKLSCCGWFVFLVPGRLVSFFKIAISFDVYTSKHPQKNLNRSSRVAEVERASDVPVSRDDGSSQEHCTRAKGLWLNDGL